MAGHQFCSETENTKEKIYEYMLTHRDVVLKELSSELGISVGALSYSVQNLVARGHLVKRIQRHATTRFAVYNLGKVEFRKRVRVPKVKLPKSEAPTKELPQEAKAVATVYRLLDRPREAAPKSKKRTKVYIGSTMSLFDAL